MSIVSISQFKNIYSFEFQRHFASFYDPQITFLIPFKMIGFHDSMLEFISLSE